MSRPVRPKIASAPPTGMQAQRLDAVEQRLARHEIVDVRRRRAVHPHVHVARIVHLRAEPGMRLELGAVRQVNGARRDVVDRGQPVVRRQLAGRELAAPSLERRRPAPRRRARVRSLGLAEQLLERVVADAPRIASRRAWLGEAPASRDRPDAASAAVRSAPRANRRLLRPAAWARRAGALGGERGRAAAKRIARVEQRDVEPSVRCSKSACRTAAARRCVRPRPARRRQRRLGGDDRHRRRRISMASDVVAGEIGVERPAAGERDDSASASAAETASAECLPGRTF